MRSSNGSSDELPDHRVAGHAALAAARGHLADDLALEALLVEAALAGHHERRGAHQLVEAERVEHVGGAVARAARPSRPRARPRGRRRRPSSARRAGRAASPRRASRAGARAASRLRVGALLRARTRAARPRTGVRTSQSTSSSTSTPASSSASSAPAPPSVVAEPPTRHDHALGARLDGRGDQLAGAARGRRPGVALVLGHQRRARSPAPSRRSRCAVRRAARTRPRPAGRADRSTVDACAARRRASPAARPSCPRRRRPPGSSTASRPPTRSPRGDRRRHLARGERALEASPGATSAGSSANGLGGRRAPPRRRGRRRRSARGRPRARARRRPSSAPPRRAGSRPRRCRTRPARASGSRAARRSERRARGALDDLGRGRAAQLHRRRVDHPAGGHVAGGRLDRLAEPDRRALVGLALDRRARRRARSPRPRRRRGAAACWPRWRSRPPRASSRPPAMTSSWSHGRHIMSIYALPVRR